MQELAGEMELTVNELVARYPRTAPVFRQFGMDMCCGGKVPVRAAAASHGVDEAALLAALQAVLETPA
jgi:regulator of cell morphogenesis and NO signaling